MKVLARLVQRKNDKTDKLEWALVSKKNGRVLKWFGARKPSDEAVQKEERRVQYFKHAHGDIDYRVEGPERNDFDYRAFRDGVFPLQMGSLDRYPTISVVLSDLQSEMKAKLQDYVERMSLGEEISMPEDEFELLVEFTENHPFANKLASLWDKQVPGNLMVFFKGLPESGRA